MIVVIANLDDDFIPLSTRPAHDPFVRWFVRKNKPHDPITIIVILNVEMVPGS